MTSKKTSFYTNVIQVNDVPSNKEEEVKNFSVSGKSGMAEVPKSENLNMNDENGEKLDSDEEGNDDDGDDLIDMALLAALEGDELDPEGMEDDYDNMSNEEEEEEKEPQGDNLGQMEEEEVSLGKRKALRYYDARHVKEEGPSSVKHRRVVKDE
tara:strand:+ start:1099 stop:1560 length:462 start_codon:yes stop_codon:yes gene_type:complete